MVMLDNYFNAERDVAECLMPKSCLNIKKSAKKYFSPKEKFLIQLLKDKLNYKEIYQQQQINLTKPKNLNPSNKQKIKFQNGKFKVLNLELA